MLDMKISFYPKGDFNSPIFVHSCQVTNDIPSDALGENVVDAMHEFCKYLNIDIFTAMNLNTIIEYEEVE